MKSKLAILGGSFDPIHEGHVHLAKEILKANKLEKIFFIPTSQNPLKQQTATPASNRLEMLEIALQGTPFEILDWEIFQTGPSYTIDTVRRFTQHFGQAPAVILGNEIYAEIDKWKEPEELKKLDLIVFKRNQYLPFSSTEIRKLIYNAWQKPPLPETIPGLHRSVWQYIQANKLYNR